MIALDTTYFPFCVVGAVASGKSNYITVMLNELERNPPPGLTLHTDHIPTRQRQNNNYNELYIEHKPLGANRLGSTTPQFWYLQNRNMQSGSYIPTSTFTLFDGSGEDIERLGPNELWSRYISACEGIIITLDPVTFKSISRGGVIDLEDMLSSRGNLKDVNALKPAVTLAGELAHNIKRARGIDIRKQLDIPVAVVITKFDMVINNSAFSNSIIKSPGPAMQNGRVNMQELMDVHDVINYWLSEMKETAFIEAMHNNFSDFCFFGVSSLGSLPKDLLNITPHRVLDPVLWLFKKAKLLQ
ncbi:MAG: hypothetical protein FWE42_00010 [Defluviitaleaceae bacterium]|nr:hypothetical protein [Defluviitaleaceae bacterium]